MLCVVSTHPPGRHGSVLLEVWGGAQFVIGVFRFLGTRTHTRSPACTIENVSEVNLIFKTASVVWVGMCVST